MHSTMSQDWRFNTKAPLSPSLMSTLLHLMGCHRSWAGLLPLPSSLRVQLRACFQHHHHLIHHLALDHGCQLQLQLQRRRLFQSQFWYLGPTVPRLHLRLRPRLTARLKVPPRLGQSRVGGSFCPHKTMRTANCSNPVGLLAISITSRLLHQIITRMHQDHQAIIIIIPLLLAQICYRQTQCPCPCPWTCQYQPQCPCLP